MIKITKVYFILPASQYSMTILYFRRQDTLKEFFQCILDFKIINLEITVFIQKIMQAIMIWQHFLINIFQDIFITFGIF